MKCGYKVLDPISRWDIQQQSWGDHSTMIEEWFEVGDNLEHLPAEYSAEGSGMWTLNFQPAYQS